MDSKGRLWVACSTTYPHVYPGNEPNDKLVILEDTDGMVNRSINGFRRRPPYSTFLRIW